MSAELFLSADDPRPMYQQIIDQVIARVMAGDWESGTALPSIREMAAASRVSVITVRRAYEELERSGVIVTRQGKGSMVAEQASLPTRLLQEDFDQSVQAMLLHAERLGLSPDALLQSVKQAVDARSQSPSRTNPHKGAAS